MEWNEVLVIGPLGYKYAKRLWEKLALVDACKDPYLDALLLQTRKYLGKIISDYKLALAQQKQNTPIKKSVLDDRDVKKVMAGLIGLAEKLPYLKSDIKTVLGFIQKF